jgi:o-succinylbenzoate synthase
VMGPTLDAAELVHVRLPVVDPIKTAAGGEDDREVVLVRAEVGGVEGWGECVAFQRPYYSSEYARGAADVLQRHLIPTLRAAGGPLTPEALPALMAPVQGHKMAKAALEGAVIDALLRAEARSLRDWLGGTRSAVACGVSIGVQPTVEELVASVEGYVRSGYRRIKLKIGPGWDVEPVAAVRAEFGDALPLQVDANGAYDPRQADALLGLDEFGLQLIEQPFAADELLAHAELARWLRTPLCLDESVTSVASCRLALHIGACRVVNIKIGRVGGLVAARAIHDLCAENDVAVWCGGMLESGVGRAVNLALATLPNFQLPGDISETRRYFREDVVAPFVLEEGQISVPTGPGIGVTPDPSALGRLAVQRTLVA